jgi:5,10-methylenetetrahydromethanopterin reductase
MNDPTQLPPVIDDLSAFIIAGRVKAQPSTDFATAARTPAQGIDDGVEAERIFISERWNLKEAAVVLSGVGARTSRIGLGTGLITPASRHPLHAAALGSTMQAAYGPRMVMGYGRGDDGVFEGTGLRAFGFEAIVDYMDILRRLWRGETVAYDGPAGKWDKLAMGDLHEGPAPELWFGTFGLPKGAMAAARAFDGVLLVPNLTPEASHGAVTRIREACEQIGRDPASIRIAQCVITAPELSDTETRQVAHARAVTYLQAPGYRDSLVRVNGWDPAVVRQLAEHAFTAPSCSVPRSWSPTSGSPTPAPSVRCANASLPFSVSVTPAPTRSSRTAAPPVRMPRSHRPGRRPDPHKEPGHDRGRDGGCGVGGSSPPREHDRRAGEGA